MKSLALVLAIFVGLAMTPSLRAQIWPRDFQETPMAKFNKKDLSLFQSATQEALESEKDGSTVTWRNPDTGASGSMTPLKTTHTAQRECRLLRIINHGGGLSSDSRFWFCKMPDGTWKTGVPQDEGG
jgi:surface antigen